MPGRCAPPTRLRRVILCLVAIAGALGLAAETRAATLLVDRFDDEPSAAACDDATPNDCSLRGAVATANAAAAPVTISLPAGTYPLTQASPCAVQTRQLGAYVLTTRALCLTGIVSLVGSGAAATAIDAMHADGAAIVSRDAAVEIAGVAIRNGARANGPIGGGGGITSHGSLVIRDGEVTDCTSDDARGAGAIYNAGFLSIRRSTLARNTALLQGGALVNDATTPPAVAEMVAVTLDHNTATRGGGGAVLNNSALLTATNATFSDNATGVDGGAIYAVGIGTVDLRSVTIAGNTARHFDDASAGVGGGIVNAGGTTYLIQNSILAGNAAPSSGADCWTTSFLPGENGISSQGYNLIQSTGGCRIVGDTTGNLLGVDPLLDALGDHGGPTRTRAPLAGSPVLDAGNPLAPGTGGRACPALDQNALVRPQGSACDIGAHELFAGRSLAISPTHGGDAGSVVALVYGAAGARGASVKLKRTGEADVVGTPVEVSEAGILSTTFDLTGRTLGAWDVVVERTDATTETIPGGFTVEAGRAADLWVEVVGRTQVRPGGRARYAVLYGNRGNVDAIGVPLTLSIPSGYEALRSFAMTPPPAQPGQVPTDWSLIPTDVDASTAGGVREAPLFLPIVPAGFTGTLEIALDVAPTAPAGTMLAAIGEPYFTPGLDPTVVTGARDAARAYALRAYGVTVPSSLDASIEGYLSAQLAAVVQNGRAALVAGLGSQSLVYSHAQLQMDLALYAIASSLSPGAAASSRWQRAAGVLALPRRALRWLGPEEALAAGSASSRPTVCLGVGSCPVGDEPIWPSEIPPPPGCDPANPFTFRKCKPTKDLCEALPNHKVVTAPGGQSFCVPKDKVGHCRKKIASNPFLGSANVDCMGLPITPVRANDPNLKVGIRGAGAGHFITPDTSLAYTIFFENLDTAAAAAQVVTVTDRLDLATLDPATFTVGPMTFGDVVLLAPPGQTDASMSVDLSPTPDLVVKADAHLDEATGVVTWTFTSLDPLTQQLTEDPLAGFLPPNVTPPEGEGSISFTIRPRAGLASGTQICNRAAIVFDANPALDTPEWCNGIDTTPPASAVAALPAVQTQTSFAVSWAGTDGGAGVADYTIYAAEDGGPFAPWLTDTAETQATFVGSAGRTYAFYSVARDALGNVEAPPGAADATTRIAAPGGEICGNCIDDDGDGKIDRLDDDCPAAALAIKKGVLSLVKPPAGDDKVFLAASFPPGTIDPPAQGVTLRFVKPGAGGADGTLACLQIPPGAAGWSRAKRGQKWTFKDAKDGSLGAPGTREGLTLRFDARKRRYEVSAAIGRATVGALAAGEISTQLDIGAQGWASRGAWRSKGKGAQLVTP